jgi:ankyrin repeat protein
MTCLIAGGDDTESVQLLMAHGAKVTASAVFAAIKKRNVSILEALLSRENVNQRETGLRVDEELLRISERGDEQHALHHAATGVPDNWAENKCGQQAYKARIDMVRLLLAHNADPYSKFKVRKPDRSSTGPTSWVRSDVDSDVARGGSHNPPAEQGFEYRTVVHQVLRDHGTISPFLELQHVDLEHRDGNGQTILLAACSKSSTFCSYVELANQEQDHSTPKLLIGILLNRGADLSARDDHGRNALHTAFHAVVMDQLYTSVDNFEEPLHLLLSSDASLLNEIDNTGKAPLHYALIALWGKWSEHGISEHTITLLLSAGADPASIDSSTGDNALHILARLLTWNIACSRLFRRFLALGVDINAKNLKGETPLFGLLQGPKIDRFRPDEVSLDWSPTQKQAWETLEEAGVDFWARDNEGRNMLHHAARSVEWAMVYRRLVETGVDPMELDERQRTSLDVAAACRNEAVLGMFEKEGGITRQVHARKGPADDPNLR